MADIDYSNYLIFGEDGGYTGIECQRCKASRVGLTVRLPLTNFMLWAATHEGECEVATEFASRRQRFLQALDDQANEHAQLVEGLGGLGALREAETWYAEVMQSRDPDETDQADAELTRLRKLLHPGEDR